MQPAATQAFPDSAESESRRSGASSLILLVAAPVLVGIHVAFAAPGYPAAVPLLAGIMATLALGTVLGASPNRLPFTMAFAVVSYVRYGSQCFRQTTSYISSGPLHLSDDSLTSSMAAATLGLLFLLATTKALQKLDPRRRLSRTLAAVCPDDAALQPSQIVLTVLAAVDFLCVVGMQLRPQWVPASLRYPLLLTTGPALYQALIYSALRRRPSAYLRILWLGFTVALSLAGAATGMLSLAAFPWMGFLVLRYVGSGRAPLGLLTAGFVAFMIINPTKHAYRQLIWDEAQGQASLSDRASAWGEAFNATWFGDISDAELDAKLEASADRLASLRQTAHTIEWVPALVPYSGLAHWKAIPQSFIPRVLWPSKLDLTEEFNTRYTTTFGLQTERATETTTLNVSLISDAYWAAGWTGIGLAYLALGILVGLYENALAPNRTSTLTLGMLTLLAFPASGHIAHLLTGVPQRFAAGIVILWVVAILSRWTGSPTKAE